MVAEAGKELPKRIGNDRDAASVTKDVVAIPHPVNGSDGGPHSRSNTISWGLLSPHTQLITSGSKDRDHDRCERSAESFARKQNEEDQQCYGRSCERIE